MRNPYDPLRAHLRAVIESEDTLHILLIQWPAHVVVLDDPPYDGDRDFIPALNAHLVDTSHFAVHRTEYGVRPLMGPERPPGHIDASARESVCDIALPTVHSRPMQPGIPLAIRDGINSLRFQIVNIRCESALWHTGRPGRCQSLQQPVAINSGKHLSIAQQLLEGTAERRVQRQSLSGVASQLGRAGVRGEVTEKALLLHGREGTCRASH
ncbi:hypothetical protein DY245_11195 [Streptomyces inhibens]|uniref:Uncharacterized protein n=1 Tax=Streptomyces inhibens TaxID=2293571 RepID=A0A371Q6L7_STRIH|nr:hypothetical protein [Streptomyces inhibens]REK90319.1 hypothetical protein DY245_11195 [Streptomyces inhibens]